MSVVVETTIGDLTIDLFTEERPKTCMNFLKLCKMKYYNLNLMFSVERNFIAQMGDPTSSGRGGGSVFQNMYGEQARFYEGEKLPIMKHLKLGTVSMASCGNHLFGSQFFITLGENLDSLDGEHLVFGQVVEGLEVISKLNQTLTDDDNRPYQDIRISHTVILNDPYPDPDSLDYPDESPKPTRDILESDYIAADENIDDTEGKSMEEIQEEIAEREAKARATILEMVGDLPDSDMAPPENVLFVCKLNPVTTSDDLEIIFSRFGKINTCEVIRDRITDNSLQYAFIEFAETKSCEDAYFKMDNVLIDDRRIHVDFSQSVSKIKWRGKGKGVEYFDDSGRKLDNKRGQNYDPNKEYDKQNDRNRNSNRGRGGWGGKDFRPSNGGPRQYYRDFNKPWERDNRRYQPWSRNGGLNRNPRDNRERYDGGGGGGRPFVQDDRDDRYGRRFDGRRNDREEDRNNRNKGKHEARRNEREGRHDEGRNDRHTEKYEGRKSEGDARHYEDKGERHTDKHEHKRSEKELKSNDERNERSMEKHEGRRAEKDDRYEEEKSQEVFESKDRNGKSSAEQTEGPVREDTHKRKHSESDDSDNVPSDNEAQEKLLKHLKKSLKKKKKKHKKYDSESDSDAAEDEKEKKKKKKKKKKKRVSSDSDNSDSDVEVRKKNKKSKKKKKKVSSDSDDSDSDSDSKKKTKKSKKKKKKKKKEALTSDSSD